MIPNEASQNKKFYSKYRSWWISIGIFTLIFTIYGAYDIWHQLSESTTPLINWRSIFDVALILSFSLLYFFYARITYIKICESGIVVRTGVSELLIPWENIEEVGLISVGDKSKENGILLHEPVPLIRMRYMFIPVRRLEKTLSIAQFADTRNGNELMQTIKLRRENPIRHSKNT